MADSTTDKVINAATATSAEVIGEAPGFAMGTVFQAAGQAISMMMQNASSTQHALQQIEVAAVSTAVAKIIAMAPDS